MATTDQRAGFRLPWSSDPRSNSENDADDTAAAADVVTDEVATSEPAVETTPEAATNHQAPETAGTAAADSPSTETGSVSADSPSTSTSAPAPPVKRPTKFMADLTRAMQAAAESAREQTLGQLQADAKAFVEEVHGRSSTEASELRSRADDDVAGIRDWSKAEIARIREETERRISARKAVLETQLERHAAVIGREIERIQGQVAAFEAEMAVFFERLSGEEDPTRFASMAESLPEPPPFEARGLTVDEIIEEAATAVAVMEPPVPDEVATDELVVADGPGAAAEPTTDESLVAVDASVEATATGTIDVAPEGAADGGVEAAAIADPEAAMASIQAAFEAAAQAEADALRAETAAEPIEATAGTATPTETNAGETAETAGLAEAVAIEIVSDDDSQASSTQQDDPRLAALGLTGFDAAEAEAAALMDGPETVEDEIPMLDDDALAARLNNLVPAHGAETTKNGSSPSVTSQVVVVGLVSVASIASFKRHLGRITGVQSVGVSSGPDGEFVFAVNHAEDVTLKDVVATLPGFQARVTNAGDGVVNVTAHDPESEG